MQTSKSFDAVLARLMTAAGCKNDSDLARALGITPQSVNGARKRQEIPPAWIQSYAEKTGVSCDWLFFGRGDMRAGDTNETGITLPVNNSDTGDTELILVPRVAARLAAGSGSLETDGDVLGHYAFRGDWIGKKGNPKRMVLMDVIGESMQPEIKHGDMVLIDQGKTDVLGYGFFAVGIDDAVYVKQLRPKPGKLILHSLNPDYDDIEVDMAAEHPEDVRIIGRVLWVGRELD